MVLLTEQFLSRVSQLPFVLWFFQRSFVIYHVSWILFLDLNLKQQVHLPCTSTISIDSILEFSSCHLIFSVLALHYRHAHLDRLVLLHLDFMGSYWLEEVCGLHVVRMSLYWQQMQQNHQSNFRESRQPARVIYSSAQLLLLETILREGG